MKPSTDSPRQLSAISFFPSKDTPLSQQLKTFCNSRFSLLGCNQFQGLLSYPLTIVTFYRDKRDSGNQNSKGNKINEEATD